MSDAIHAKYAVLVQSSAEVAKRGTRKIAERKEVFTIMFSIYLSFVNSVYVSMFLGFIASE